METKTEVPKSLWERHGIGIVLDNRLLSKRTITFTIPEHTPMISGELIPDVKKMEVEYTDIDGNVHTVNSNTTLAEEATWLPGSGWFDNPPDVRRGETVIIWRYGKPGNNPIYFWESIGLKRHLRRKETMRILLSGDEREGELGPDNTYMVEISGHTNSIIMRTGKANGEVAQWMFSLLGNEGIASVSNIMDNNSAGIGISLDATRDRILANNAYGCFLEVEGPDGTLFLEGNLKKIINGDEITEIQGNRNVTVMGDENITVMGNRTKTISGNSIDNLSGTYTNITVGSISYTGATIDLNAASISSNGAIWLNGPIGQIPNAGGNMTASLLGPLNVEKETSSADFTTPKVPSYNVHFHHYDGSKPTSNPKG